MLRKLVMILLAAAAAGPALAMSPGDTTSGGSIDPMAECDCQRYGYCPAPPPGMIPLGPPLPPPPPPPPPPPK